MGRSGEGGKTRRKYGRVEVRKNAPCPGIPRHNSEGLSSRFTWSPDHRIVRCGEDVSTSAPVGWDVVKDVIERALVRNAEIDSGTAKMTLHNSVSTACGRDKQHWRGDSPSSLSRRGMGDLVRAGACYVHPRVRLLAKSRRQS
jgi:hypothetical protein